MRILFVQSVGGGKKPWWNQYVHHLYAEHEIEFTREPRSSTDGWKCAFRLLRLYVQARHFDVVVTLQDGHATFLFAILNRLRFRKPFRHVVLELITRERHRMPGARAWLKYSFLKFAFRSVDRITCSAREEINYYAKNLGIDESVFAFVPLAADPVWLGVETATGEYIVSAGRTGRDYATLLDAVRDLPLEVRVIAGKGALDGLRVPPNVKTYFDIPPDDFIEMLASSRFVVIPLEDRQISVGQTVILQAMALGKGVVTSDIGATRDYVENGATGVLVPAENVNALREAIVDMHANPVSAINMGSAAKALVRKSFVPERTWPKTIRAIEEIGRG